MSERFTTDIVDIDDYKIECADAKIVVKDGDIIRDNKWVVKQLNDYEKIRKRKNAEISKLKKRENMYQRVIGGMMAYIELHVNGDLWWDWNED